VLSGRFGLVLVAVALLGVVTATGSGPAQAAETQSVQAWLAQQQAPLKAAAERRNAQRRELRSKQALHERLAARIAGMRKQGLSGYRLEALQRHARSLAEEVAQLQRRAAEADEALASVVARVHAATRSRLDAVERRSPETPDKRRGWIEEQRLLLSLLRAVEPKASAPLLPSVPTGQASPTDGPEELRELADELADVRETYLSHAAALRRRIETLQEQQRLVKLAADLEREEGLFDESYRYRTTGRARVVQRPSSRENAGDDGRGGKEDDTPAAAPEGETGGGSELAGGRGQPTEGEDPNAADPGGDDRGAGGGQGWGPDDEAEPPATPAEADGPGDGAYNGDMDEGGDPMPEDDGDGDLPGDATGFAGAGELSAEVAEPAEPGSAAAMDVMRAAPAEQGGPAMVEELQFDLHEEPDSSLSIGGPSGLEDLDVATQLQLLQSRRRQAREQARRLERRMRELRREASDLEHREGW